MATADRLLLGLSDLFGGGLNDSHNSDSGGILNGGSWRRRLMPTAVGHIAYKENSNDVKSNSTKSSPTGTTACLIMVSYTFSSPKIAGNCKSLSN